MELFKLNDLNNTTIQIYGTINGTANLIEDVGRKVYIYDIKFFKNGILYKVKNINIRTLSSKKALSEKLTKLYNESKEV